MFIKTIALASTATSVAAASLLAIPATSASAANQPTSRAGDVIKISGPPTAKIGVRFPIMCAAPKSLVGGKVLLYQNGNFIRLSKVTVSATGACNFKVSSGISGMNNLDVAITKAGKTYQSNSLVVKLSPGPSLTRANVIKLSAAKTAKLWKRINIKCQAPASLAGGTATLFQDGKILPQKKKFTVSSDGSCNFWVMSGITGVNKFDMAVTKNKKVYQASAVKVRVS